MMSKIFAAKQHQSCLMGLAYLPIVNAKAKVYRKHEQVERR